MIIMMMCMYICQNLQQCYEQKFNLNGFEIKENKNNNII